MTDNYKDAMRVLAKLTACKTTLEEFLAKERRRWFVSQRAIRYLESVICHLNEAIFRQQEIIERIAD